MIVRRDVLKGAVGGAGLILGPAAFGQTPSPQQQLAPFAQGSVLELARSFAKTPYKPSSTDLPDAFSSLNFEQYVGIRYRGD